MTNHEAFDRRCQALAPPLALALLLLLPATTAFGEGAPEPGVAGAFTPAPAAASSPQSVRGFTLGLDASLPGRAARASDVVSVAAAPSPRLVAGTALDHLDLRAIVAAMPQQPPEPAPAGSAPSDGSFGRWLKRHWWIPALVGAAVLATAGESLYDDDDVDDED